MFRNANAATPRTTNRVGVTSLSLQRRLAASLLKCGQRRVYLDPRSLEAIDGAKTRKTLRKLIGKKAVMRKNVKIHSRSSVRVRNAAKAKGRHTGTGKRKGTRNARMPLKVLWMRRARILRRLLKKYREKKKIDKHQYRTLYMQAKGNRFKTKRNLIETIHRLKTDAKKAEVVTGQIEARKKKAKEVRDKKAAVGGDKKKAEA